MILVVGDSMLDRYWEGKVERISPEAPVPVLQVTRESARAGGAANVAVNLAALGSDVSLLTLIGDDAAGSELRRLLDGVTLHGVKCPRTLEKIRFVASRQQLLRSDFDEPAPLEIVEALGRKYRELPRRLVVLSDYAKGSLRDAQRLIAEARCRVLVDPKGIDFTRYAGSWLVKPNEAETRAVVGEWSTEADFRFRCEALREELAIDYLLVTRGERGMTLFGEDVTDFAAERREVYDVSGAGDTVIATLAHFIARGLSAQEAVYWANRAAGVVVGKFGTASVTMEELA